eukprot:gene7953-12204_t
MPRRRPEASTSSTGSTETGTDASDDESESDGGRKGGWPGGPRHPGMGPPGFYGMAPPMHAHHMHHHHMAHMPYEMLQRGAGGIGAGSDVTGDTNATELAARERARSLLLEFRETKQNLANVQKALDLSQTENERLNQVLYQQRMLFSKERSDFASQKEAWMRQAEALDAQVPPSAKQELEDLANSVIQANKEKAALAEELRLAKEKASAHEQEHEELSRRYLSQESEIQVLREAVEAEKDKANSGIQHAEHAYEQQLQMTAVELAHQRDADHRDVVTNLVKEIDLLREELAVMRMQRDSAMADAQAAHDRVYELTMKGAGASPKAQGGGEAADRSRHASDVVQKMAREVEQLRAKVAAAEAEKELGLKSAAEREKQLLTAFRENLRSGGRGDTPAAGTGSPPQTPRRHPQAQLLEAEVARLQADVEAANRRNNSLQDEIRRLSALEPERDSFRNRAAGLEEVVRRLSDDLANAETVAECRKVLSSTQPVNVLTDDLVDDITGIRRELQHKSHQLRRAEAEVTRLNSALDDVQARELELETSAVTTRLHSQADTAAVQRANQKLKQRVAELEVQLEDGPDELDTTRKQAAREERRHAATKAKLDAIIKEQHKVLSALEKARDEKTALKESLREKKSELDAANTELASLRRRLAQNGRDHVLTPVNVDNSLDRSHDIGARSAARDDERQSQERARMELESKCTQLERTLAEAKQQQLLQLLGGDRDASRTHPLPPPPDSPGTSMLGFADRTNMHALATQLSQKDRELIDLRQEMDSLRAIVEQSSVNSPWRHRAPTVPATPSYVARPLSSYGVNMSHISPLRDISARRTLSERNPALS